VSKSPRSFVFLGLSITSSWGNGHATTYRGLIKELAAKGHQVTFLERDVPWYAQNREFTTLPFCRVHLYQSLEQLKDEFEDIVRQADAVLIGSYVPDGIAVARWAKGVASNLLVFYDIDTPVTLAALANHACTYLSNDLVAKYDLYLSFTGGPTLQFIENRMGSPCARPLYCSVDPAVYFPQPMAEKWAVAYLGTYAPDRQHTLEEILLNAARCSPEEQFAVAGPQYPDTIAWPSNVRHIEHLPASGHRAFYNSQRFALNVTRRDMIRAGYSPSVRLFEAAACGIPILTDEWTGLHSFFKPRSEIIPVRRTDDVLRALRISKDQCREIAERARKRVLRFHTAAVRAGELEAYIIESENRKSRSNKVSARVARRPLAVALTEK
jgi:spore maturation protein CgeB